MPLEETLRVACLTGIFEIFSHIDGGVTKLGWHNSPLSVPRELIEAAMAARLIDGSNGVELGPVGWNFFGERAHVSPFL